MIQDIVEAAKELEAQSLGELESLGHRNVPLKRVPVAEEQQLSKLAGSCVPGQELGIGAAIRTDEPGIDREALQIRKTNSARQAGPGGVEHILNLIQGDTGREANPASGGVVAGIDGIEAAGELYGLPRVEDKD